MRLLLPALFSKNSVIPEPQRQSWDLQFKVSGSRGVRSNAQDVGDSVPRSWVLTNMVRDP